MTAAVYPGTFDPFTAGHRDVAERARLLFDRVTVLVAVNDEKHPGVPPEQRAAAIREQLPAAWTNVAVATWAGLTADYCHAHRAQVIIRGVRNAGDLRQEQQLAAMNLELGITTLYLPTRPALATVSSSGVRALTG
ncbi:pantetheine-phosphate adenylyltransferase [Actinoplanes sp. NBRC 103695]|uniref:pantetheine-phosphate adenylyltransferase n=1 Tax=Actinoplanes sp. NBRC 103695 TaxID=3032202 RepID=UPI0024A0E857|nr:pantetheine-phosphate adenylyltransferase [Actinoplanes sp. NBRC 103695]GLZ00541.1 phosphopantetheine adenylyltransferase [Actinoplanes sp. NBRC 103695]